METTGAVSGSYVGTVSPNDIRQLVAIYVSPTGLSASDFQTAFAAVVEAADQWNSASTPYFFLVSDAIQGGANPSISTVTIVETNLAPPLLASTIPTGRSFTTNYIPANLLTGPIGTSFICRLVHELAHVQGESDSRTDSNNPGSCTTVSLQSTTGGARPAYECTITTSDVAIIRQYYVNRAACTGYKPNPNPSTSGDGDAPQDGPDPQLPPPEASCFDSPYVVYTETEITDRVYDMCGNLTGDSVTTHVHWCNGQVDSSSVVESFSPPPCTCGVIL